MKTILVTGAKGFIAGYLIEKLLDNGYYVIGIDNNSKYGDVEKSFDDNSNYEFINGDAKDTKLLKSILVYCDDFVANAAMVGGIPYFHLLSYDLFAENESIARAAFDAAIYAFRFGRLKKITILSSSMIYENAKSWPSYEGQEHEIPSPFSTYGFQKLALHYWAKGAYEQYKLPYIIIVPFNAVGTGEYRAKVDKAITSGNVKLSLGHVIPDLIQKVLVKQNPLHLFGNGEQIRHYTYAGDIATAILLALNNENAINKSFNISTDVGYTVIDVAKMIWEKVHGNSKDLKFAFDAPFQYDVKCRIPSVVNAKNILGFEAKTTLSEVLDEMIPWIKNLVSLGKI